ncbi:MAG: alanine--tRNA ligase-related protein [Candidatus Shikimatogenerans bostrichidophilus]|nr:MAG: alanine--tRNA ligase-related protein [Candidatus Shikimatogenerans bostrichidophilus]
MKYNTIKKKFIFFFKKNKHKVIKNSSIINKDKSKLLFVNSGINKLKNLFINNTSYKFKKITNIQKCIRISGKDNDLKLIGKDNYHHTMFEMLGNWSIGEYNIKKAIKYAWILITKVYKIPKNKIIITVFKGNNKLNLKKDIITYNYWKKFIPKKRIFFFDFKNNFWKIENFNLCGPCTEIYIYIKNKKIKNINKNFIIKNKKYFIELWNIVNIKYLIKENKIIKNNNKFSKNYIDTGMGLERLCMVLQNKTSTYDTDIFKDIIKSIERILKIKYNTKKKNNNSFLIKIIADHIRTIFVILYDKILPSNNKYGYVLRKLIRRCLIYVYKYLNIKSPFLYKLIISVYKTFYKKINQKKLEYIKDNLKTEEFFYFNSIKKNIKLMILFFRKNNIKIINKKIILYIYSTYGINYFIIKKYAILNKIKIISFKLIYPEIEL